MTVVEWAKPTRSNSFSNCVEVGRGLEKSSHSGGGNCAEAGLCACGGDILVRDTKDRAGGTLAFGRRAWAEFLAGICAGEFPAGG